jgi:hypothetical protein
VALGSKTLSRIMRKAFGPVLCSGSCNRAIISSALRRCPNRSRDLANMQFKTRKELWPSPWPFKNNSLEIRAEA